MEMSGSERPKTRRARPLQLRLFSEMLGGPTRRCHREKLKSELLPKRWPGSGQSAPKSTSIEQRELPL
jgi:hypothetical protein